eukprot:TRINITY_DN16486_c0_g1_i2.p1 TRINITY_DN16486_c0_g1~~TRINITY_DN16486_c0_g1_i2.p1  ORF type:complete len:407 (-),score=59.79 TRINITY_DN16486_c0_g1_i2:303-1478(-)
MGIMAALLDRLSTKVSGKRKGDSASASIRHGPRSKRKSNGGLKRPCQQADFQSLSPHSAKKRREGELPAVVAASPQAARRPCAAEAEDVAVSTSLLDCVATGPYLCIASYLDAFGLCQLDAACGQFRGLNNLTAGPWHALGNRAFYGMELDVVGGFQSFGQVRAGHAENWKARCDLFKRSTTGFSSPYLGREILQVDGPDEVAYCRCRLRTDLLALQPNHGVYVEVEVLANVDNLSLAVVDFEGGGRSSVTFSPETGAVLRECKVRETPRAIEGKYIHLLPPAAVGQRFRGSMGLYLQGGQLAFFRRWRAGVPGRGMKEAAWETTGFCTDLNWAQGERLSLCLAFRDSGPYRVAISKVGTEVPFVPKPSAKAFQESKWKHLYGDDDHPLAI